MVRHDSEVTPYDLIGDGIKDVAKQVLAGPRDGFGGYLRKFTVSPGGHTPYHRHDWYHLVYIVGGEGVVTAEGIERPIREGSVVHVEAGKEHGFTCTGTKDMQFLCLVPESGDQYNEKD